MEIKVINCSNCPFLNINEGKYKDETYTDLKCNINGKINCYNRVMPKNCPLLNEKIVVGKDEQK